jgi:glycosyltransferase involved in cell wall biosynthesis
MGNYFAVVTCRKSLEMTIRALTSIKEQTIKPDHAIMINDGSSDKTHDILAVVQQDWPTLQVIMNPDLGYDISRAHERVYSVNNPIPIHRSVGSC